MSRWELQKMRAATVGCGRIGVESSSGMSEYAPPHLGSLGHLQSIAALGFASELAACDANEEALANVEGRFGVTNTYTDVDALLSEFRPELLTIATRTPAKHSIFTKALDAGVRAIHMEKPLCNSTKELAAFEELFQQADILVTSGCMRRFLAPFRQLKSVLNDKPNEMAKHISICQGLAPLMWSEFHCIDLILFLAGSRKPLSVQGYLSELEFSEETVVNNDPLVYSATIIFEDNLVAEISAKPGHITSVHAGNQGMELRSDGRTALETYHDDPNDPYLSTRSLEIEHGEVSGMQGPLNCLAMAACGDQDSILKAKRATADFMMSQKIAFALIESQKQGGRIIELDRFDADLTCWGKTAGRFT